MLRRRLTSALFIDFENVQLDADGMAKVLNWIEDGVFDGSGRRRKLLVKSIYWNSTAERNRARYEALGFDVVLCEKYANLKNGADIRIAMDMVDVRMRRPNIQEFILISKDSDFVPVLERLRARGRRTAMLVDESKPSIYTVYSKTADTTFPLRRLMGEGRVYVRTKRPLFERLGLGRAALQPPLPTALPGAVPASASPLPTGNRTGQALSVLRPSVDMAAFDLAVEQIVAVAARNGGQSTGRQTVTKELRTIPLFSSNGTTRYFGHGSYDALMRAVADRDPRVIVRSEKGGGISLVFVGPTPIAAQLTTITAPASV